MSIARLTSWYFLSSISLPLLGLLMLPIYTTRLGPEQFGIFALGSSLAMLVSATAGSVSTLSLPAQLNRYQGIERRYYLGAVLLLAVIVALISCIAVFAAYLIVVAAFDLGRLGNTAIILTVVGALFGSLWAICIEIITIEGRAKNYALTVISQNLISAGAVCIALFVLNDIDNALFWGFVSSGAVGFLGAIVSLSGRVALGELVRWAPIGARGATAAVLASLSENGRTAVERSYVGFIVGSHQLGLLAHGQYYKNASMMLVNAVSRGIVPTSLREANEALPAFRVTLQLWVPVQAMVLGITLGFVLIGRELLGLLTHGKFEEAAPYAVAMMLTLLLQTLAKPHVALLLARGQGNLYAHMHTVAIIVGVLWLLATVPFIGVWGAITSFGIQTLVHRVGVYWAANRIHRLPLADLWVVVGFAVSGLCAAVDHSLHLDFLTRVLLLFTFYFIILWRLRPQLFSAFAYFKTR